MKNSRSILGVELENLSERVILEKIQKYIKNQSKKRTNFLHIVSLNPENLVEAHKNNNFIETVRTAQIRIVDGFGVVLMGWFLGLSRLKRVTGVDLMEKLVKAAQTERYNIMLIGGKGNIAEELALCYEAKYPKANFLGIEAISNIKSPSEAEEKRLFSIVADYKPHIIFTAFGSPHQEMWLNAHKTRFSGIVCMGVGGAFDFLGGKVPRAPFWLRKIGLEWLFRLAVQPWRIQRQANLLRFTLLVFKQKLGLL